ncbi:MAG TPA: hypothetical protein VFY36_12020 [Solirubrobacteraceae bacterium]|nr:hypothetical protein [Solirubrobacteraceae bacterium]
MLGLALSAALWLTPPPVLPGPSRTGPEGPPRPYGFTPSVGGAPAPTDSALARAQDHALRDGPFPRGGLARGVSDGTLLLSEDPRVRALAVERMRAAGASVVRIPVHWRESVIAAPLVGFDARDPASSSYRFALTDAAVISATSAGLRPLLVVSHAPAFAEAPGRWPYAYLGSWAPSPAELGRFAAALARRYDGTFPDASAPGGVLPRVSLLQAWNEPNLARYLEPQWVARGGRWSAFSPLLYRQMLNAFYAGVKSVQPRDTVVAAGVAPNGDRAGEGRMSPIEFLRRMLCLGTGRGGRAIRAAGCAEPAHFDVLAYHPLSIRSPDRAAVSSLDVSIADAAKVTRLLGEARRMRTALPAGGKPVWVTELNWESAPQSPRGVPSARQARWISRALHRLWVAGVGLATWQFLVDPFPGVRVSSPSGGIVEYPRPAGLYNAGVDGNIESATPKAFLQGFALPFDPLRVDRRHMRVWALLARAHQAVLLQRLARGGAWRTVRRLRADRYGVLNALVAIRAPAHLRLLPTHTSSRSAA